jgi:hypothetical protein
MKSIHLQTRASIIKIEHVWENFNQEIDFAQGSTFMGILNRKPLTFEMHTILLLINH